MRVGILLVLSMVIPLTCLGSTREETSRERFRVTVEIEGNRGSYVATLKDAWGSYLAFRDGVHTGKTVFKNVPSGDFSLRVEFDSGTHIWRSLRVDGEHVARKNEVQVKLKASDAVATADTLESTHTVSAEDLAVPEKAREIFRKAWAAMELSDWSSAQQLLDDALALAPGYFQAWNNAGVVARKRNDLDAAENYFRRAAFLDPESFEANVNLSEVLGEKKQLAEAIRFARKAQQLRPNDPVANAQLGIHLFHGDLFEECIPYLQKVAKQDPQSFYYPQILLAVAFENLNQPFQALEQVEDWLKHHKTSPDREVVAARPRQHAGAGRSSIMRSACNSVTRAAASACRHTGIAPRAKLSGTGAYAWAP